MRRHLLVLAAMAAMLAGCGRYDVRSFEETPAQFVEQRSQLEALVVKIQRCGAFHTKIVRPCGGEISRDEILADLKRLGLKSASSSDGTSVQLVNGDDGTELGVMSGMVHYTTPQPNGGDFETPLTPPPHYWFYTQHD